MIHLRISCVREDGVLSVVVILRSLYSGPTFVSVWHLSGKPDSDGEGLALFYAQ